jgi:hypothetical protein
MACKVASSFAPRSCSPSLSMSSSSRARPRCWRMVVARGQDLQSVVDTVNENGHRSTCVCLRIPLRSYCAPNHNKRGCHD